MDKLQTIAHISHPLFTLIMEEHKLVLSLLNKRRWINSKEGLFELIIDIIQTIELDHHTKEEILIFNKIYEDKKILNGGPQCSLYFDFHMNKNIKKTIQDITQKNIVLNSTQEKIYKNSTPLNIPIDEHAVGKTLLYFIFENFDSFEYLKINSLLNIYTEIQLNHIQKEEKCFYYMCASILSVEQADTIKDAWISFDPSLYYENQDQKITSLIKQK